MMASAQVVSPKGVSIALTLTMTVKEWEEFAALLPGAWPGWPVASMIRQAIGQTVGHVETVREVTA